MRSSNGTPAGAGADVEVDYEVLVIGAGLSGMYTLIRMRQMGVKARVLEAGSSEGGTWFWYGSGWLLPKTMESLY